MKKRIVVISVIVLIVVAAIFIIIKKDELKTIFNREETWLYGEKINEIENKWIELVEQNKKGNLDYIDKNENICETYDIPLGSEYTLKIDKNKNIEYTIITGHYKDTCEFYSTEVKYRGSIKDNTIIFKAKTEDDKTIDIREIHEIEYLDKDTLKFNPNREDNEVYLFRKE